MFKIVVPRLCELPFHIRRKPRREITQSSVNVLTISVLVEHLPFVVWNWMGGGVALAAIGAIWNLSAMRNGGKTKKHFHLASGTEDFLVHVVFGGPSKFKPGLF